MDDPSQVLARNLSLLEKRERTRPRSPTPQGDRTLQTLVADLVAARTAAGLTQVSTPGGICTEMAGETCTH